MRIIYEFLFELDYYLSKFSYTFGVYLIFLCVLCAIYLYDCKINILPLIIRRGMYVALYKLCLREYDEQGHFTIMPQALTSFFILYIFVLSLSLDLVWLFAVILLEYFTFLCL